MTDNRDEIVRLAVELAQDVLNGYESDKRRARDLLALASPPEPEKPERFPGIDAEPKLWQAVRDRYQIYATGEWSVYGPLCNTPAAAVAAWNEMIDRITGADEETVRLIRRLQWFAHHYSYRTDLDDTDRWLAARKGWADAK